MGDGWGVKHRIVLEFSCYTAITTSIECIIMIIIIITIIIILIIVLDKLTLAT